MRRSDATSGLISCDDLRRAYRPDRAANSRTISTPIPMDAPVNTAQATYLQLIIGPTWEPHRRPLAND